MYNNLILYKMVLKFAGADVTCIYIVQILCYEEDMYMYVCPINRKFFLDICKF